MMRIAYALEIGHPFAYFLIFMLIGIPSLFIILFGGAEIIEKMKNKRTR